MRKERRIINTNIRLNLCDEQDRKAWEYLQTMDRQKYKSYTKAVVAALNDYFAREYRNKEGNCSEVGANWHLPWTNQQWVERFYRCIILQKTRFHMWCSRLW